MKYVETKKTFYGGKLWDVVNQWSKLNGGRARARERAKRDPKQEQMGESKQAREQEQEQE